MMSEMRYFMSSSTFPSSEVALPKRGKHQGGLDRLSDFLKLENTLVISTKTKEGLVESQTAEQYMSQLTGEYNRSLLEQPHNVELWLEFLAFQDQLLEWGHLPGDVSDNVSHKKRALTDRKVSIYERALEHNPLSEDLIIGHMSLVQDIWPTDKTIQKWKNIVFHQPNKPRLWLQYIHFCQTSFSTFGTSSLISLYTKCITTLSSILEGTLQSHLPAPDTLSYLLAIFSNYCSFLRQVGLTERALASYQALVEFNLCRPSGITEDKQKLKEFFEPFWDSGTPRFGENEALGWANWTRKNADEQFDAKTLNLLPNTAKKRTTTEKTDECRDEDEIISGLSLTQAWLKLEDHRMMHNWFPWQPKDDDNDEDDCSDPDRMVTFDDVSPILFAVMDSDMCLELVFSFLNFLGAPVNPSFHSLINQSVNLVALQEVAPSYPLAGTGNENNFLLSGLGLSYSISSEESLVDFATSLSKQLLSESGPRALAKTQAVCDFISNVCNQSLSVFPQADQQTKIITVWLSFLSNQLTTKSAKDLKHDMRLIQKLIKSLLRLEQHRNNLTLWNYYASFEHFVGNFKEARNLYMSLLAQHPSPDASLCCTLCECFMGVRKCLRQSAVDIDPVDTSLALHALVCLAEGKNTPFNGTVSPAKILKARSHFHLSRSESAQVQTDHLLCSLYFEYLTRNMKEVWEVFHRWEDRLLEDLKQDKTACLSCLKQLYRNHLCLLEAPPRGHFVEPLAMRKVLERALNMFPDDPQLMASFIRSEQQSFISGRMRRHFDRTCLTSNSASVWLYALAAEMDRFVRVTSRQARDGGGGGGTTAGSVEESSVGTVHRMMSLLSRATGSSEASRHCPLLWRVYLVVQVSPFSKCKCKPL